MWSSLATCKKGFLMDDFKTNYSVARVVTHTRDNISKFEKHNARKNGTYSNMNVDLSQTPNNVYYKQCDITLNEKVKEMVANGEISLRGLKKDAKIFDELVFDINSEYFEQNGGYEFAKEFYEKAFHFAEQEMGSENILQAVMHADELNVALTEKYNKPIYHYHLHAIALPIVKKDVKYSKRCKDKSLVGKVKEVINQVSHSKKWLSEKATDNFGNPLYDKKGKPILIKSYSLLQDRFFQYMSDSGYRGFIRGVKGSTNEHLDNLNYKIKKENERLENLKEKSDNTEQKLENKQQELENKQMELNNKQFEIDSKQDEITKIETKLDEYVNYTTTIDELDNLGKQKRFSKKVEIEKSKFEILINLAKKGISSDRIINNLETRINNLVESVYTWKQRFEDLQQKTKDFMEAIKIAPQKVTDFLKDIIFKEQERIKQLEKERLEKLYNERQKKSSPNLEKSKKRRSRDAR